MIAHGNFQLFFRVLQVGLKREAVNEERMAAMRGHY